MCPYAEGTVSASPAASAMSLGWALNAWTRITVIPVPVSATSLTIVHNVFQRTPPSLSRRPGSGGGGLVAPGDSMGGARWVSFRFPSAGPPPPGAGPPLVAFRRVTAAGVCPRGARRQRRR